MINQPLEEMPRLLPALAEWSTCLLYISMVPRRLKGPALGAALAVGLGVIIGVQELTGALPLGLWSLGMTLAAFSMFLLIWACTDTNAKAAGDLLARAFVLAELSASLAWQLDQHFFVTGVWTGVRVLSLILLGGACLGAAWLVERRNFPAGVRLEIDGRTLAATLSIAVVTFLLSNLSFVNEDTPFSGRDGREIFYIRTLVDLAGFIALYAMRGQRLHLQRAIEVQSMNSLLHHQHQQYLRSREEREAVNARYHDLKNYITAIRGETDATARSSMVDQLEESIRGYGAAAIDTGNAVVDTVLASKMAQADVHGITVTSVVEGTVVDFMDVMDVVTVFGNALDNAIEATAQVRDRERRLIRVAVYRQGHFAILRFENWFGGELSLVDGLPATTKDDAQHHGYGLKNIRQAAERYDGTMAVESADGWFVLRMLIPLPV
ncbi:sensor histidine kinase [Demequina soli]|uniref:sensor histidine kinase n=1 Tax=Demequina soli TaxID=1638987 RepID=UPI0007858B97|nr:GHKL domain-containing protein [Demequina soli]